MVTVVIPTKGRKDSLDRCIKSIPNRFEIMIFATCNDDISSLARERASTIFIDNKVELVEAVNTLSMISNKDIFPCADDFEFMSGSLEEAEKLMDALGNDCGICMKTINMDGIPESTMLVGRNVINRNGWVFYPEYRHFYADADLGMMLRKQGKLYVSTDIHIKHYHPVATKIEDATHNYKRNERLAHDSEVFNKRMAVGGLLHA